MAEHCNGYGWSGKPEERYSHIYPGYGQPQYSDHKTALTYFVAGSRDRYNQAFTSLGGSLNAIFSLISEFKVYKVYGSMAECGVIRIENGTPYSYPVTFVQDENGVWKIMGF